MLSKKVLMILLAVEVVALSTSPLVAQEENGEPPVNEAAAAPAPQIAPAAPPAVSTPAPTTPAAIAPRKSTDPIAPKAAPFIATILSYGFLTQNLSTGGGEFKTNLPKGAGDVKAAEIKYFGDGRTHRLRYRLLTANYEQIANVEPNDLKVTNEHISFTTWKPLPILRGLSYGRGLYTSSRNAQRTEPKIIVNKQWKAGILAYGQYFTPLLNFVNMELRAEVGIPFVFREPYRRSGSFFYGADLEGGAMLSHVVARWQELALGVMFRQESVQFAGSGDQGSSNAHDVQNSFWFPFELRIRF